MRKFLCIGVSLVIAMAGFAAENGFWNQLTAEERVAAGVAQLTAAQQVALDQAAARFAKEGARKAIEVAKVEAQAEAKAEVEQTIKQREKARVGLESKEEDLTVSSRITDTFRGWSGQTLFRLENGQTWVQSDKTETYIVKAQEGPLVEIRKSGVGGWKLHLMPNGRWVRVKRVN